MFGERARNRGRNASGSTAPDVSVQGAAGALARSDRAVHVGVPSRRSRAWGRLHRWATHNVLAAAFPPTCVLCGAPGQQHRLSLDLCAGCAADLPTNRDACARCARPFDTAMPSGSLCGACQRRPPPFDSSLAAFRYAGAVPSLVVGAKFRARLNLVRVLGLTLVECIRAGAPPRPEVIIPVPLHASRQRGRGYNQALEIARIVGRELHLPVDPRVLRRIHPTPPQTGLDAAARRRNLRGAFRVEGTLRWRHVVVLDDVVTTGSTVYEIGRLLRAAGVDQIQIWAVARTP